jgi:hypothetical protein
MDYHERFEDYRRHLRDLRDFTYEGRAGRADREAVFRQAVELLSPVACQVLEEFNTVMLAGTGRVVWRPVQGDGQNGLVSLWLLAWPLQQGARARPKGPLPQDSALQPRVLGDTPEGSIDPIIVRALRGRLRRAARPLERGLSFAE